MPPTNELLFTKIARLLRKHYGMSVDVADAASQDIVELIKKELQYFIDEEDV
jgi:hypothetical protein